MAPEAVETRNPRTWRWADWLWLPLYGLAIYGPIWVLLEVLRLDWRHSIFVTYDLTFAGHGPFCYDRPKEEVVGWILNGVVLFGVTTLVRLVRFDFSSRRAVLKSVFHFGMCVVCLVFLLVGAAQGLIAVD